MTETIVRFGDDARRAVYDVIALRRDVRHFGPGDVAPETLLAILGAAHLAPSVGFSQPWGFVVVRDGDTRARVRESFLRCRAAEASRFSPERREKYLAYRLEGILESAVNVCVAVDLRPQGEAILGATVQPEAVRASACCAVQNLWLAARAEGVGVGWVSIVEPAVLRRELALPEGVEPIAYLCLGEPRAFRTKPMLEELGWLPRRPVEEVVHEGRWREPAARTARALFPMATKPTSVAAPFGRPIARADQAVRRAAQSHQAELTKPRGSLGRLEEVAATYAASRGEFPVRAPERRALALFLADHGVAVEGVSAYGSQVTAAMACNVAAGRAAVNVLAAPRGVAIDLVDVGIAGDLSALARDAVVALQRCAVRAGTRNLRVEPAMTRGETEAARGVGARVARAMHARGIELAAVGEIGIANTTSAAALVSAFTGARPEETCGRGSGVDDATVARKVEVVRDALALHAPNAQAPLGVIAALGGLEIAAMVGFLLEAAALRLPVVLDGFVANAAALAARALDAAVVDHLFASHLSAEGGARLALDALGLAPLLSLELRLGEGTGALLAFDLITSAVALQDEMCTFASAGIPRAAR